MKKFLVLALCLALGLTFLVGCGKKEAEQTEPAAGGHAEEMADSTRMDSAAGALEEAVDTAAAAVEEAAEEAVEKATGH